MLIVLLGFSLGFDICGDPEHDPPQHIEQQQQGKQFDHANPIFYKAYFIKLIITLGVNFIKFGCCLLVHLLLLVLALRLIEFSR